MYADKEYIVAIRRELHMYPEIGFDLPRTIALVKRELDKIGVEYTEKYGKSSVVATINPEKTNFTIGIRADMDALLIDERNAFEYRSQIPGHMHACGHDAHTAMLLCTAKVLYSMRDKINCRVKLLFQPSEEGADSGAFHMVEDGVMDDIDVIIGCHIENWLESGTIGVCKGMSMASNRTFKIEVFGKTAHATLPHSGKDALAEAVRIYTEIQFMLSREINPFDRYVCSIGKLSSGTSNNVIADYAEMLGTIRTYDMKVDEYIINRIREICGSAKLTTHLTEPSVYNDPKISQLVLDSAIRIMQTLGNDLNVQFREKWRAENVKHKRY